MSLKRTTPRLRTPAQDGAPYHAVWSETTEDGRRITRRRSLGTADRADAEHRFARFLTDFLAARPVDADGTALPTLQEVADAYLHDYCAKQGASVQAAQARSLRAPLAAFGDEPLARVSPQRWGGYVEARKIGTYGPRAVGPATIRRELGAVRAAARWAVSQGLLARDHLPEFKMPSIPQGGGRREVWLDESQLEAVVSAADQAPDNIRLPVYLCAFTGARRGAVLDLTWDRVDLTNGLIDYRVPAQHTGRKRRAIAPIGRRLRPVLEDARLLADPDEPRVVTGYGEGHRPDVWAKRFSAWAKDEGFPELTPHVFRHTFITLRLRAGVDPWKLAGVLNEDVRTLLRVYGHHCPQHLTDVVDY